jgi:aminoglycoside phosphotransferase family enzyme
MSKAMGEDCPEPALREKVAFLRQPQAYEAPVDKVEVVETHMSWVFLLKGWVFKLKKPVRYQLLDFSTLEARRLDCEEEVRLNRRLAPDVYVGVVPLTWSHERGLQLEGPGRTVDWLVKMRRLPAERMLDRALVAGTVGRLDAARVASVLVRFYRALPAVEMTARAYRQRLVAEIEACCAELAQPVYGLGAARVGAVAHPLLVSLGVHQALVGERAEGRHIVEGHGDLRPEHVCLLEPPVVIDCLAFNRDLRILDAADEIAYLAMECERLGAAWFGAAVVQAYREAAVDDVAEALMQFYGAYRALVRAKLAAWHTHDAPPEARAKWIGRALQYLTLAEAHRGVCA